MRALRAGLLLLLLPLASGLLIVHYRDAAVTHFPAKAAMVEQLREGHFPFLNPLASCGQPLAGNPNHAVLFPDTLMFALAPLPLAFGFHFALALALAWMGARRWARAEGASPAAAECAAYAFALSGPYLSAWTFYNAGMALAIAPWLLAAVVKLARRAGQGDRRGTWRAAREAALVASLLTLAGEPVIALLAAALVTFRLAAEGPAARRALPALAAAAAVAMLVAGPQILLTWQATRGSSRDLAPYDFQSAVATSVHPARALEQLSPFPWGRPDRVGVGGFHRPDLFQGNAPYLWTLHLGWVPLVLLVLAGSCRSRAETFGATTAGIAALLSLGGYLPWADHIYPLLSLGGRIRYPVKWWYAVVLALVPLVAFAAERCLKGAPSRARRIGASLVLGIAAAVTLVALPFVSPHWVSLLALLVSVSSALPACTTKAVPLVTACAVSGLVASIPLLNAALDRAPPVPRVVPSRIYARGGEEIVREPDLTTRAYFRRAPRELWNITAARAGVGYAFDPDPDGSYALWDRRMREAIDALPWPARLAELRLAGVSSVVSGIPLSLPFREAGFLDVRRGVMRYALDDAQPAVRRATRVLEAVTFDDVIRLHAQPTFSAASDVVVAAGAAAARGRGEGGRVEILEETADSLDVRTEGPTPAVLVWSRSYFPAWEASVDGTTATVFVADGHLVGLAVAEGAHEVRLRWSRRPLWTGLVLLAGGVLGWLGMGRFA